MIGYNTDRVVSNLLVNFGPVQCAEHFERSDASGEGMFLITLLVNYSREWVTCVPSLIEPQ